MGAHDLTIKLSAGSENIVTSSAVCAIEGRYVAEGGPSLIIEGTGTLNINGSQHGIWVWHDITIQDSAIVNVKCTGTKDVVICNNDSSGKITVAGNAQVKATGGEYGIGYSDPNTNTPIISGGTVTLEGNTTAFKTAPDLNGYTGGYKVTVGEDAAGGAEWDGSASLSNYKYLKIEAGQHTHNWDTAWRKDENSHWHDCLNPGCNVTAYSSKDSYGGHVYDNDTDTNCNTCGYTRTVTPSHTHSWLATWSYDETHHWHECGSTGCDVTDNSNKNGYAGHTGGTATCRELAVCSDCNHPYGSVDSSNHTGGTEIRDRVDATATTPGYASDTYCLGCGVKIGTGTTIAATGNTGDSNTPSSDNSNSSSTTDDNDDSDDSSATSDSTAAAKPDYATHIVQKGDTLGVIARKYGYTVAGIMAENKNLIKNVNLIYPGWLLKIPQSTGNAVSGSSQQISVSPNAGKTRIHVVKRGDNLWAIARKYGCTSAEIIALNSRLNANPNLLYAGWELVIPER